jgi:hypothetical protein
MTVDRQGSERREWPVDSLFISESFRSVNLARSTAERDGGAGAVSFLQRCSGRQRFAFVIVRENNEAKEATANCPRITLAKLPSLAQQNPYAGPCIAPPPTKNVTVPSIVPKNGLLHLLVDVVVHDKRRADKESVIQVSAQEENATAFPYGRGGWSRWPSFPSPAAEMLLLSPLYVRTSRRCGRTASSRPDAAPVQDGRRTMMGRDAPCPRLTPESAL